MESLCDGNRRRIMIVNSVHRDLLCKWIDGGKVASSRSHEISLDKVGRAHGQSIDESI